MEIILFFAEKLYAIHFEDESDNEWQKLNEAWTDVELLEAFFEEHRYDLGYFGRISVVEAVIETLDDADDLFEYIQELANDRGGLDHAFKNLDNNEYRAIELSKKKAKGLRRKSWLRIYAIKIDTDIFLITGGAIKLTNRMEEREHTKRELAKLQQCKSFLEENGIVDEDTFRELGIRIKT